MIYVKLSNLITTHKDKHCMKTHSCKGMLSEHADKH